METPPIDSGEEFVDEEFENQQRVQVSLHPLGGVKLAITDVNGDSAEVRLGLQEAWNLIGQVQAFATFIISSALAQAFAEQAAQQELLNSIQKKVVIPGRK